MIQSPLVLHAETSGTHVHRARIVKGSVLVWGNLQIRSRACQIHHVSRIGLVELLIIHLNLHLNFYQYYSKN